MVSFRINGEDKVDAKLAKLQQIEQLLGDTTKKAVLYVHSQIPPYPSPPAASTYVRTGTLGRTLTSMGSASGPALSRVEGAGSQVRGYVGTAIKYAPYVIGDNDGKQAHQMTFWWRLVDVVEKSRDGIRRIYDDAVSKLTK